MKTNIAQETAKLLFDIKAISLQLEKPFQYTSGIFSPIYVDNRVIFSYPTVRVKIVTFLITKIINRVGLGNVELISGTATAAIPYAAFISQMLEVPMVYVRDTKKGHGKKNQVEGVVANSQKVLVVEDHITTGGSAIGNAKAIKNVGGKVKYVIAATTYNLPISVQNFKKNKLKVFTLTNINEIIEIAVKRKLIKIKDRAMILEWSKDPSGWGKKFGFEK